ncbi:10708_t:CDS:2, partial [Racocetra fulgida]
MKEKESQDEDNSDWSRSSSLDRLSQSNSRSQDNSNLLNNQKDANPKLTDPEMFPVAENIVYDIIHICYKNQRELHLFKQQPATQQDNHVREKHMIGRRNEDQELQPIKNMSVYHSPKVSESDEENPSNGGKIITKDLKWCLTT